LWSDDRVIRF